MSLEDYIAGLKAQSIAGRDYTLSEVAAAFGDLLLSPQLVNQLAQAVHSGKGLFLYGPPGNGKTSIAERLSNVLGEYLWIPRVIGVEGEIIRLFDPCNRVEMPLASGEGLLDHLKDRPPLGAHSPSHVDRRRRTDDGTPGSHHPSRDRHLRSSFATEEQRRHAGDR